jgi:REP element-mobilizing transposase RayT
MRSASFLRKSLPHLAPTWVKEGDLYFLTLCCERRGLNQLCLPETADALLASAEFYHRQARWFVRLFLLMPDHLHALVAFPGGAGMSEVIRNWKRHATRTLGIRWQRNFFDHRIRNRESWDSKAEYIRQNPVRAKLIDTAVEWPYVIEH